tara:strand:- start:1115 stop:1390 length:276 start_codon:yes stop_codon:yes gene_type:complete
MVKKRDRLEVIHDLFRVIQKKNNSIKPTPLLRQSNLSSQRFAMYLQELMEKGFIEEVKDKKGRKHIRLTTKGFQYLEKYNLIRGFIEEFDL